MHRPDPDATLPPEPVDTTIPSPPPSFDLPPVNIPQARPSSWDLSDPRLDED